MIADVKPRKNTHKKRRVPAANAVAKARPQPVAAPVVAPSVDQPSTDICAWCGTPVAERDAFVLRVGARLCPACAKRAGEIAAEQGRKN